MVRLSHGLQYQVSVVSYDIPRIALFPALPPFRPLFPSGYRMGCSTDNIDAGPIPALPYWQVNVPPEERSDECPEALQHLSAKDVGILSTPDDAYNSQTWPEVRQLVAENRLDLFQRVPSELRRYRIFVHEVMEEHGSVMNFILGQRLHWTQPLQANGRYFQDPGDVKILFNDWPYGIDERIKHLVVWTKFVLEDDPLTGDLKESTRAEVGRFVGETFRKQLPKDTVISFRNCSSLKSVHAVEHFHVMLFDPPSDPSAISSEGDTRMPATLDTVSAYKPQLKV
ncbi:hypothetical protein SODALDRAFT_358647 [Sodiomyces alkalinus F11]|uniref:N-acetylglucosamine-induced protein 1 n=1 Tax=Sodiomyces alkalinus (strain CBS 110278 / VKM F-3762 / F11) TaxID=1314773 RepID=A0A3N2Q048_SODAK|nr:hypothetical protein SODALDRAFT_358647 [Sodiomyces alkalinus F11]ROT40127.1 hypothetical protein SODALDRAFT_358647 [Sodiomyces alkalinus F11]